jgi:uncharacterized protein (DUF488 family)
MINSIYTIGHSNRELNVFVKMLRLHNVDYIIDVRFIPFSRYVGHFNKENLSQSLKEEDITYIFMGNLLGIDYSNESYFNPVEHYMDYRIIASSPGFIKGMEQVLDGIEQGFSIALMCSEKDPLDCHRAILVSRELKARGIKVTHILDEEGNLETHNELEARLQALYNKQKDPDQIDLFAPEEITLEEAYMKQNISMSKKIKLEQ